MAGSPPPPLPSYPPPPPPPSSFGAAPQYSGEKIPNYLIFSVLMLCCCWPLAIVAIVFGAQVNSKVAQGDYAGAREASSKAKLFCWLSLALGLIANIIVGLFYGAAILSQMGR